MESFQILWDDTMKINSISYGYYRIKLINIYLIKNIIKYLYGK